MPPRIVYYYQTLSSLEKVPNYPTYVYLSAFHFTENGIHLNNSDPDDQPNIWKDMENATQRGLTVLIMLGGAGGAYTTLFSDFEKYFMILINLIRKYPCIKGIDLDVEEYSKLIYVRFLVRCLDALLGQDFIITMAPTASAMISDGPGLGGFSYADLCKKDEGRRLTWFNVQAYGDYTLETYEAIIQNKYAPEMIVFGLLGDKYDDDNTACREVKRVLQKYPTMAGVYLWEYGDTHVDPLGWGQDMKRILG